MEKGAAEKHGIFTNKTKVLRMLLSSLVTNKCTIYSINIRHSCENKIYYGFNSYRKIDKILKVDIHEEKSSQKIAWNK